jgi:hypothetical protein
MLFRHYGVTVDTNVPMTGVVNNHSVEFLHEEICAIDAIDIDLEAHRDECETCKSDNFCDDVEMWDMSGDTIFIGAWKKTGKDTYEIDKENEKYDYAAIVRECVTQVVWSKHVTFVRALCSPCYPGQADLDSGAMHKENEAGFCYLCYTLPWNLISSEEMPLPEKLRRNVAEFKIGRRKF